MALNTGLVHGRRTVVHSAIDRKDLAALERLLDKGEDIEISGGMYGETPLMYAIYKNGGFPDAVRLLIQRGADVNATVGMQRTPLMIAAEFNRVDIAQDLIAAGADATIKYLDGRTAAGWARRYDHKQLAATLEAEEARQVKLLRSNQDQLRALTSADMAHEYGSVGS
mmetsp:Transcript_11450/g.24725  ORF Transcript_11450/g.24725 Transcript_11450/m.24725 type:complete len:168 (+) Transcript_11450:345-848(+)